MARETLTYCCAREARMATGDFFGSTSSRTRGVLRIVVVATGLVLAAAVLLALFAWYRGGVVTPGDIALFFSTKVSRVELHSAVLARGAPSPLQAPQSPNA